MINKLASNLLLRIGWDKGQKGGQLFKNHQRRAAAAMVWWKAPYRDVKAKQGYDLLFKNDRGSKLVGLGGLHNPSRKNLGHLLTSKKQVGARQEQKSLQCLAIRRPFGMHGSTMREGGREEGRKEEPMWEPTRELMSRCRSRCWSRCRYEHGRGFRWRACQHRVHPLQAGNGDSHQGPIEQCRGRRDEIERSR